MTPGAQPPKVTPEWQEKRQIYTLYRSLAQQFSLAAPTCPELESVADNAVPPNMTAVRNCLQEMDGRIQVHHLRQFFQTSTLANEANLRVLIRHHLQKKNRLAEDRDKLDFLLVQYFSQCAPTAMLLHGRPTVAEVAKVLEPALGGTLGELPPGPEALEGILGRLSRCTSLRDLLQHGVLTELRQLKNSAGEAYFGIPALVTFTRVNFLIRQTFFRLMHADLDAIRICAQSLEKHGVARLDCTRAQLSSAEPVGRVLALAQQWRGAFRAEYSAGNSFAQLAELRRAVEEALVKHGISEMSGADPFAQLAELRLAAEKVQAQQLPDEAIPGQPQPESKRIGPKTVPISTQPPVTERKPVVVPPPRRQAGGSKVTEMPERSGTEAKPVAVPPPRRQASEPKAPDVLAQRPRIESKAVDVQPPPPQVGGQEVPEVPGKAEIAETNAAEVQPPIPVNEFPAADILPPAQPATPVVSPLNSAPPLPSQAKDHSASAPEISSNGELQAESTHAVHSALPVSKPDLKAPPEPSPSSEPPTEVGPSVPAPASGSDQLDVGAKLETVIKQLSEYLLADRVRSRTMGATIVFGQARLALSSWEMRAFLDPTGSFSKLIQQGVAARVLMFQVLEQARQGSSRPNRPAADSPGKPQGKLTGAMTLARAQAAQLQQAVGKARQVYDIEATVALSAAAQQLTNLLREAEQFMDGGK